jgi:hypothetical protein
MNPMNPMNPTRIIFYPADPIPPCSYEKAAIPPGDAMFRKQFGLERLAPLAFH